MPVVCSCTREKRTTFGGQWHSIDPSGTEETGDRENKKEEHKYVETSNVQNISGLQCFLEWSTWSSSRQWDLDDREKGDCAGLGIKENGSHSNPKGITLQRYHSVNQRWLKSSEVTQTTKRLISLPSDARHQVPSDHAQEWFGGKTNSRRQVALMNQIPGFHSASSLLEECDSSETPLCATPQPTSHVKK